ncbi:MAG TPA: MFS transporter [Acidobacteriaceae bacterium]
MPNLVSKANMKWALCGLLFLATTINYMDRSVLSLIEPILKHLLGGDQDLALYNRHYSDIVACFIAAYGFGFLIAGPIVDRFGAKRGYAVSAAVWACASISHAFASTTLGFALARFGLGLGESGNFPAALKATADWFPAEERALATGIFNSGTSAASLVAPLLIPWVTYRFGWHAAFFTTGGMSLCWLILWLAFPYQRLLEEQTDSAGLAPFRTAAERVPFKSILSNANTWRFAFSKCLTDPIWWFYLFWLPKFLNERFDVDMRQMGLPLIVVYAGSTIGSIAGGWLGGYCIRLRHDIRSGRRLAMLICALGAVPVLLVPFVHEMWTAIGLLCLATSAHQGWSSNLLSTPSDAFASSSVGRVVGVGGAVGSVGGTLFTSLTGVLWTNHSLLIFGAAGTAYLIAMATLQSDFFLRSTAAFPDTTTLG